MTLPRRAWLKLLFYTPWLVALLRRSARAQDIDEPLSRTIEVLVDTLVPGDEAPGAVALGIHVAVEENIRAQKPYLATAERGIAWLEAEARQRYKGPFAALDEAGRTDVLGRAESSARTTAQRMLFDALRDEVLQRYYSHPGAWPQLGFQGPPQPRGFEDYRDKPGAPRG